MPSRRRNTVDPLQLTAGRLRRARAARRRPLRRDGAAHRRRGRLASTSCSSTRPASAASRGTGCTCPPTSSTRSPATSAARRPACTGWAARTGSRPRGGPVGPCARSPASSIRLYAARMAGRGHAFGPDTPWQRELEDAFPYTETPDQDSTIDEVKADMETVRARWTGWSAATSATARPRSRCARRSRRSRTASRWRSWCPRPCWSSSTSRRSPSATPAFPVKVAALSRFQTDKEARAVLAGLADGHRRRRDRHPPAVQRRTRFKDLGLVIVDEEQRFGVEHKEHLKALRTNVDVLTMSATPIPRTLEMAVTGIREMSTIATPPEERHPILTYVGAYDDRSRSPRRSAASCSATARCSSSTTGSSRSSGSPRSCVSSCPRRGSPSRTGR